MCCPVVCLSAPAVSGSQSLCLKCLGQPWLNSATKITSQKFEDPTMGVDAINCAFLLFA